MNEIEKINRNMLLAQRESMEKEIMRLRAELNKRDRALDYALDRFKTKLAIYAITGKFLSSWAQESINKIQSILSGGENE